MSKSTCIGFGDAKGNCKKPIGSDWESPYFCQECDEKRIYNIDKNFQKISEKFGIPFEPLVKPEGKTDEQT